MTSSRFWINRVMLTEICQEIWEEVRAIDVLGRSAQLAYYFFFALFPFLICIIASLSVFGSADRGRALLFQLFARFLPVPAFQLISATFNGILKASGPLKMSFGILVSLWSASMGMTAIMDTLNSAYRVKETRSLVKRYAVALGLTVGITLILVVSILAVLVGKRLATEIVHGGIVAILWKIMQWPIAFSVLLLVFAVTYHYAPNVRNRKWHCITPGSVAGIALLLFISIGLRVYFRYAGTYTLTFGSLGAVIVLLLSFYLGGVAVISGGILNAVLDSLASRQRAVRRDAG
jgi:membrane protein